MDHLDTDLLKAIVNQINWSLKDESVHTPFLLLDSIYFPLIFINSVRVEVKENHKQRNLLDDPSAVLILKHLQELLRKIQTSFSEDESLAGEQEEARGNEKKGEEEEKGRGREEEKEKGGGRKTRLQELQSPHCCRQ